MDDELLIKSSPKKALLILVLSIGLTALSVWMIDEKPVIIPGRLGNTASVKLAFWQGFPRAPERSVGCYVSTGAQAKTQPKREIGGRR